MITDTKPSLFVLKKDKSYEARLPYSSERSTHIEFNLYYNLGGINYLNSAPITRGYKLSVRPVQIGERMISFTLLGDKKSSGFAIHLQETKRFSMKELNNLKQLIEPKLEKLFQAYTANPENTDAFFEIIFNHSSETLKEEDLNQFTGTEKYYRHWTGLKYTDGVHYVVEKGFAYWLLDAIISHRRTELFQVWELTVNDDKSAILTMKEDSDKPFLVQQKIKWTDFPLKHIKLWMENEVLYLPSEH